MKRILLITLCALLPVSSAFATPSDSTLDLIDTIHAYYYDSTGTDPTSDDCVVTPSIHSTTPSGTNITWIGDSYTATAEDDYHLISTNLPGTDLGNGAYYQVSKHIAMDGGAGNLGGTSGLNILKDIKSKNNLNPFLVFALGTNDADYGNNLGALETQLNILIDSEHTDPTTTIILVSPRTNDSAENSAFDKMTEGMRNFANAHSNVLLADWNTAAKGKESEYFSPSDSTHPNEAGFKVWFDTIKNTLPGEVNNNVSGLTAAASSSTLPAETVQYLDGENVKAQVEANLERYKYAEQQTGLPWQILAALHYREAGLGSNLSISNGEELYDHTNVDGVHISADPNQDAKEAAEHFIEMAKTVYGVDVIKDPTTENYALAFLAYNRGFMYKNGGATWEESPYVMNGYDSEHLNMRFIHADSWNGGQQLNNLEGRVNSSPGALAFLVYLGGITLNSATSTASLNSTAEYCLPGHTPTPDTGGSSTLGGSGTFGGSGNLTDEQAAKLLAWYSVNKNDDTRQTIGPDYYDRYDCQVNQCTAFSTFFLNKFTNLHGDDNYAGSYTVDAILEQNPNAGETSSEPSVFSLFQAPGHTGIVVGQRADGSFIYANYNGHNCKPLPEPLTVITDFNPEEYYAWNYGYWSNMPHVGVVSSDTGVGGSATYLKLEVDITKLMNYIENGP